MYDDGRFQHKLSRRTKHKRGKCYYAHKLKYKLRQDVMLLHDSPIQQTFPTSKFSPCSIMPWICKVSCFAPCSPTKTAPATIQWETEWTLEPVWTLWRQISCYYQELNPDILVIQSVGELLFSMTYLGHKYKNIKSMNATQGNALLKVKPATKWVTLIPSRWQA